MSIMQAHVSADTPWAAADALCCSARVDEIVVGRIGARARRLVFFVSVT